MGGAANTTEPTFYVSYAIADAREDFKTIDNNSGSFNGAAPVTLVAAPSGGDLRHDVRDVTIFNLDDQTNTITIRVDVAASKFNIWKGDVPAGGYVKLENSSGRWTIYDSTGAPAVGAPSPAYTVTNGTTDRTYDANSTTVNELADVLGTVISDLQGKNILG